MSLNIRYLIAGVLGGGLVPLLLYRLVGWQQAWPDLAAGWSFAALVLLLGHLYLRFFRRQPAASAHLQPAVLSISRLLVLLIGIIVVEFIHFYRTGPFLAGLLPVYFTGVWGELTWLAVTSARSDKMERTTQDGG